MPNHIFATMGTVASVRVVGEHPDVECFAELEKRCLQWDERFSLYRTDSEISQLAQGQVALPDTSDIFLATYAEAIAWRAQTHGAFTPHRPDGVVDLSGIVKALAIADIGAVLAEWGHHNWLVTLGGDSLAQGHPPERAFRVGIVDPADRGALLCGIDLESPWNAVATSGISERGEHVWRTTPGSDLSQVTVLAPDIVTADVLATAILAGGKDSLSDAVARWDIDVIAVDVTGEMSATRRARSALGIGH